MCDKEIEIISMDIKQEPEDDTTVTQSDVPMDLQWRIYQKEISEDNIWLKTEAPQDSYSEYSNSASQMKIMHATTIAALSKYSTPESKVMDICVKIEDNVFKNQEAECETTYITDYKDDIRPYAKMTELEAVIKLYRVPFYERNFVCNICFSIFSSSDQQKLHKLVRHETVFNSENGYKQDTLYYNYFKSSNISKIVNNGAQFNGNVTSIYDEPLLNSKKTFDDNKPHKCDECSYTCARLAYLKVHKLTHTEIKPYICGECEHTCSTAGNLKLHKRIHSKEKPFKCEQCNYASIRCDALKVHKMTHSPEKPFKCDKCDYTCKFACALKIHKIKHSSGKIFKCDKCSYSCIAVGYLNSHITTVHSEKKFKCDECKYSCAKFYRLKIHKMKHLKERPFKCDKCTFSGAQLSSLKVHKRNHSGEKHLKCDVCEYRCRHYSQLKRHKMYHFEENGKSVEIKKTIE